MPTFTTATIVKARVKGSSLPTDAEVNDMIDETEGYLEMLLRKTLTFADSRMQLCREMVTNYAAVKVIAENPANYASTAEASLAADILWATAERARKLLEKDETVIHLES